MCPADVEDTELQITAVSQHVIRDQQGQKRFDRLPWRSCTGQLVRQKRLLRLRLHLLPDKILRVT
eukprot:10584693-Heterocapsa_arctica.AAC.1